MLHDTSIIDFLRSSIKREVKVEPHLPLFLRDGHCPCCDTDVLHHIL